MDTVSNIKWDLISEGVLHLIEMTAAGTEHTTLRFRSKKIMAFRKSAIENLKKQKMMFIQLLRVCRKMTQRPMIAVKEKTLNKRYKGLTDVC